MASRPQLLPSLGTAFWWASFWDGMSALGCDDMTHGCGVMGFGTLNGVIMNAFLCAFVFCDYPVVVAGP